MVLRAAAPKEMVGVRNDPETKVKNHSVEIPVKTEVSVDKWV